MLVDEVYLDAVYDNTPRTSFHLGPEFVVTSSLTKVYGVSGLRCGWILAQPDLARKMHHLNDLYSATPVFPGELLSVAAFQHLDLLRERARRIVEADRKLLRDFLKQQSSLSAVSTEWGTTSFPRLLKRKTRTLFSSACGLNSTPPQFQVASSKCPIIFASAWA